MSVADDFTLLTPRLVLRDFREDDLANVHDFRSDLLVLRFMDFAPESFDESRTWLDGAIFHNRLRPRSAYNLAIAERDNDRAVGWIGFGDSERHPGKENFGVGYMLASSRWGRGLAAEALQEVVRHVFCNLGGETISAHCYADNTASERVMQKAGFHFLKRYQDAESDADHPVDRLEYGLRVEQWKA